MSNKRDLILEAIIPDMVSNFLYYDRKECEDLPVGKIEKQVAKGKISVDEMVDKFREELTKGLT